jgi:hypothetical protein
MFTNLQSEVFCTRKRTRRQTTALSRIADGPGATSVEKRTPSKNAALSRLENGPSRRQVRAAGAAESSGCLSVGRLSG